MIGKSLTPKYAATTKLYVDPRELQLVDRELTPRAQDISGMTMVVESQARLITSNTVLLQVIQNTNLDKDPEFGGESKGILTSLLGLFGLEVRSAGDVKRDQTAALEALNRHIYVKKTDRSFIVDVEVWSYDPAKAAMLANAIANAYLAESKNSQATAARRATSDLSGRLKELQERLRTAENALSVYKAQNNFVGTQDTVISDQQLTASNQRLAAARAQALDAQAKYDQIEASRRGFHRCRRDTRGAAVPDHRQFAGAICRGSQALCRVASELGPIASLRLRQMEKQVWTCAAPSTRKSIAFAHVGEKRPHPRPRLRRLRWARRWRRQKTPGASSSARPSVRLRELERATSEASRDVYQSFLKRSRETEEQESLNTSSARIIGEATVPQRRVFPPADEPGGDDRLHAPARSARRAGCLRGRIGCLRRMTPKRGQGQRYRRT